MCELYARARAQTHRRQETLKLLSPSDSMVHYAESEREERGMINEQWQIFTGRHVFGDKKTFFIEFYCIEVAERDRERVREREALFILAGIGVFPCWRYAWCWNLSDNVLTARNYFQNALPIKCPSEIIVNWAYRFRVCAKQPGAIVCFPGVYICHCPHIPVQSHITVRPSEANSGPSQYCHHFLLFTTNVPMRTFLFALSLLLFSIVALYNNFSGPSTGSKHTHTTHARARATASITNTAVIIISFSEKPVHKLIK